MQNIAKINGWIRIMEYKHFYFCNLDFGKQLTGVERSALKRARLFKNYFGISATFLTTRFNEAVHENVQRLKDIGWMPKSCEVYNVYEYLRGAYIDKRRLKNQYQFDASIYNIIDIDLNPAHQKWSSKVNSSYYKYVIWTDKEKTKLSFINNLYNNKIVKREKFDRNGQLISIQELSETGKIESEDLIHLDGHIVLRRYFGENNKLTKIILFSELGRVEEILQNEEQLVDYWLRKFIDFNESACFVIDRNPAWNIALKNHHRINGHKTISIFHSSHLVEMEDNIMSGRLNSNFKAILEEKYTVDHIVTLTEHQKQDILKRFVHKNNIVTIPHSIDELPRKMPFEQRNSNKLVALCRLAPEKQVVDMVKMMGELLKTHPKTELYIYGDGSEKNKIIEKIKELNIGNNVHLMGYNENIADAYTDAVFSLLTSKCEGFSLAILESLSYGIPAASYNIPYGPSTMIQHRENGILVDHADYKAMANELSQILSQPEQLKQMCDNAYNSIERFKEENVSEVWRKLIDS